jgi:hypothetical protein
METLIHSPAPGEERIKNAIKEGKSKLTLENGLYVLIRSESCVYYRFRYSINGKKNDIGVGKFGEMTFEVATEIANQKQSEIKAFRENALNEKFKADLTPRSLQKKEETRSSSPRAKDSTPSKFKTKEIDTHQTEKSGTFASIDHAREFISYLIVPKTPIEQEVSQEFRFAILLMMLIPAHLEEISKLKGRDFYYNSLLGNFLILDRKKNDSLQNNKIVYISSAAMNFISSLINKKENNEYLFPTLSALNNREANLEVLSAINRHWRRYRISSINFVRFFKTFSKRESFFVGEFIDTMLLRDHGYRSNIINEGNIFQRNALFEWWGHMLTTSRPDFSKSIFCQNENMQEVAPSFNSFFSRGF